MVAPLKEKRIYSKPESPFITFIVNLIFFYFQIGDKKKCFADIELLFIRIKLKKPTNRM